MLPWLLRMRSWSLLVRSAAAPRVSNHEATRYAGSPPEPRHQLDMRRVTELVDRRHRLDPVAAIDENPCIARERRDVAGDRDHHGDLACRELKALRLRALPRRVEYDSVVVAQ